MLATVGPCTCSTSRSTPACGPSSARRAATVTGTKVRAPQYIHPALRIRVQIVPWAETPSDRCPSQSGPSSAAASRPRASAAGAERASMDRVRRPKTPIPRASQPTTSPCLIPAPCRELQRASRPTRRSAPRAPPRSRAERASPVDAAHAARPLVLRSPMRMGGFA